MKSFVLSLLIFLNITSAFAAPGLRNGTETNGGDGFVAEFVSLGGELLETIRLSQLTPEDQVLIEKLKAALSHVSIRTVESLELDGREVDAINQPNLQPPKITISRARWIQLTVTQKRHLIIHELLPVIGVNDADYKVSTRLAINSSLIVRSNTEVFQAFYTCSDQVLSTLKTSDLEMLRTTLNFRDPVMATVTNNCKKGLRILIQAGFDMNVCHTRITDDVLQTPLAYLDSFSDKTEYEAGFRDLLISAGATNQCSTSYP